MAAVWKSPLMRLWLTTAAFCLAWAELGRLAHIVPRAVLDQLFPGADRWWGLPTIVHAAAVAVAAILLGFAARNLTRSFPWPEYRSGRVLVIAVSLLGVFLCLNQFGELEKVVSRVTDFGTIIEGATALYSGGDPYSATEGRFFYPPLTALLFGPLTWFPLAGASLLFFSLKLVLLVWTLAACDRLVGGERFSAGRRALFVFGLVFVASRFWIADLQYGNTNVLIMSLVVAAIFWDRDDRPLAAGLALALAVSIKIVPVVLCLHFLILGRWRTLAFFTAGLAAFHLVPWIFLQGHWRDTWIAYLDAGVTGKLNQRLAQPDNQSLWGVINRIFPAQPLDVLRWVWFLACAGVGIFAGWVSWSARGKSVLTMTAAAALYPLLGLLASPGSWVVHYTAVLLPMAVLWMLALSGLGSGRWAWPLFAAANFALTASGWFRPTVHASITQSWFVMAAVLLLAGLGVWALGDEGMDRE